MLKLLPMGFRWFRQSEKKKKKKKNRCIIYKTYMYQDH